MELNPQGTMIPSETWLPFFFSSPLQGSPFIVSFAQASFLSVLNKRCLESFDDDLPPECFHKVIPFQ